MVGQSQRYYEGLWAREGRVQRRVLENVGEKTRVRAAYWTDRAQGVAMNRVRTRGTGVGNLHAL